MRRPRLLEHFDGHIAGPTCSGPTRDHRLLRLAGARAGQPVVAWTARESGHPGRPSTGTGTRNFRATPLIYSPNLNSCVNAVAVNRGRATIVWKQSAPRSGVADLLVATQSSPGSGYPAPTTVARDATDGATLTIDPISHKLVAAWVAAGQVRVSTRQPRRPARSTAYRDAAAWWCQRMALPVRRRRDTGRSRGGRRSSEPTR